METEHFPADCVATVIATCACGHQERGASPRQANNYLLQNHIDRPSHLTENFSDDGMGSD